MLQSKAQRVFLPGKISDTINDFDLEEVYKLELDCCDAMRASARLVDDKWVELTEQSKEKLVVVFFTVTMDCSRGLEGPCHMIVPEFEKLSQEYSGAIFVKMDVDAPFHGRILSMCSVHKHMFTLLFFKDGQKVDELKLWLGKAQQIPALREKVQLVFNEHKPADVEVEAPVRAGALCSHEGCANQFRAGGLCSQHGAKQKSCSMEGCKSQAQKGGVCVTHGAKTKHCGQDGCSKQVVRGGKCKGHGQSKRPEMFWGQCSKCPLKSSGSMLKMVN